MTTPLGDPPHQQVQPHYDSQEYNAGVPQQYTPSGQNQPVMTVAMKEAGLAYVLWFFLGNFGVHKFYMGKSGIGIVYVVLGVVGWMTVWLLGLGLLFLLPLWVMLIIDLFTMSSQVRKVNETRMRGAVPSGF
jgi:TM2 domain-containing membrane protein YozV